MVQELMLRNGAGVRVAKADPTRDYLSGGAGYGAFVFNSMADHALSVRKLFGDDLFDKMELDSTVSAGVNTLKAGVLSDGMQFTSPVSLQDVEDEDASQADFDLAWEIAECWNRAVSGMDSSLEDVSWQMLEGVPRGCMLAEVTYRLEWEGPDAGRLMPAWIRPLDRRTWNFEVDDTGKVVGFSGDQVRREGSTTRAVFPREKFILFSWMAKAGDPRGVPALDAAYDAWNAKQLLKPEYWKYLNTFASPSLVGKTAENSGDVEERDADGNLTGEMITAAEAMLRGLVGFQNNQAIVVPFGAEVNALNPAGDGSAFERAFEFYDRQIVTALLHSPRAMMEAKHSSKSDSETAQDTLGALLRVAKKAWGEAIRNDLVRPWVRWNWGDDAARRLCPVVSMGATEMQDFSRNANAVARLASAGLIPQDAVAKVLAWLGMSWVARKSPEPEPVPVQDSSPNPNDKTEKKGGQSNGS